MVHILVDYNINDGSLDAVEALAQQMINLTQQEIGALDYQWCLSSGRVRCRVITAFEDGDAVLAHYSGPAVQEFVPKLLDHATATRFEVYGDPGPDATEMLKGMGAEIFPSWHGFSR